MSSDLRTFTSAVVRRCQVDPLAHLRTHRITLLRHHWWPRAPDFSGLEFLQNQAIAVDATAKQLHGGLCEQNRSHSARTSSQGFVGYP